MVEQKQIFLQRKHCDGRNLRAGEFQFKLTTRPADGSNGTVLQKKQNGVDGSIAFDSSAIRPRIQRPEQVQ